MRPRSLLFTVLVSVLLLSSGIAHAARVAGPSKPHNTGPTTPQAGLAVNYANLAQLLDCLVGPGVAVNNAHMTGAPVAFGTFSGGAGIIGFDSGIILSSGDVFNVVGPNVSDAITTQNFTPGDPSLDAIVAPNVTYDAANLEFDFTCDQAVVFSLTYVFGSDEYNEYVNSQYNDVFGFFLDGNAPANNIAVVPAVCSDPGRPVAINDVNCNNPYFPPTGDNCDCYRNNDLSDGGGSINTELDGLTHVFARVVPINPGTHHLKIVIADTSDNILDSDVFLACQSLACAISTPAHPPTWGKIKLLYR
jgi:hypothetical protein